MFEYGPGEGVGITTGPGSGVQLNNGVGSGAQLSNGIGSGLKVTTQENNVNIDKLRLDMEIKRQRLQTIFNNKAEALKKKAIREHNAVLRKAETERKRNLAYIGRLQTGYKSVNDEVDSSSDRIMTFSKAFSKLSYEKFSPEKLKARINKSSSETTDWNNNLNSLSGKISSDALNELRGMGVSGMGITKALSRADDSTRNNIMNNYTSMKNIADKQSAQTIIYEHKGSINITGIDGNSIKVQIADIIGNSINNNGARYSLNPVVR